MSSKLLRRGSLFLGLTLAASASSPAWADAKWMIIGEEPDPTPNRSVYIVTADDAYIFRSFADGYDPASSSGSPDALANLLANTVRSVIVYQVFENARQTNFISYTVEFKCQAGLVRIPQAISYDLAGKQRKGGSPDWLKVPDTWIGKAEMIACKWNNWQSAKQIWASGNASSPKRKKAKEPAVSFASLGMEYLGEANYMVVTGVVDLVWKTRWADAVHPGYYEGTAKEKAESAAQLAAVQAKTLGVLTEQRKWTEISLKLSDKADRIGGKFGAEMASVGGLTEEQIIARWGAPGSFIERSGIRTLTYYFSDTQYGVGYVPVDIVGPQGKVGATTQSTLTTSQRQCSRTLHLREGGAVQKAFRVFDFDIGCN